MKKVKSLIEKRKTLKEQIVDSIKESIASGELRPGEKICETKMADELGISRTPLREAIQALESEGLLSVIPRKGAVVSEFSSKDIEDIYEIKARLEGLAASLSAKNLTKADLKSMVEINEQLKSMKLRGEQSVNRFFKTHNQFHDIFLKAAGNERLYQLNCQLLEPLKRFRLMSLSIPGRFEESTAMHDSIIEAFAAGDAKKAERLVMKNVKAGGLALIKRLQNEDG